MSKLLFFLLCDFIMRLFSLALVIGKKKIKLNESTVILPTAMTQRN